MNMGETKWRQWKKNEGRMVKSRLRNRLGSESENRGIGSFGKMKLHVVIIKNKFYYVK